MKPEIKNLIQSVPNWEVLIEWTRTFEDKDGLFQCRIIAPIIAWGLHDGCIVPVFVDRNIGVTFIGDSSLSEELGTDDYTVSYKHEGKAPGRYTCVPVQPEEQEDSDKEGWSLMNISV